MTCPSLFLAAKIIIDSGELKSKKKYHIDTVSLNYPKKDMDVETYMKDGMIDNWDLFEKEWSWELLPPHFCFQDASEYFLETNETIDFLNLYSRSP